MDRQMHEIRRSILQKLWPRFVGSHGQPDIRPAAAVAREGDTRQFNRVLALWLDLQKAIEARDQHIHPRTNCAPSTCPDQRVRESWLNLTQPGNVLALEQLFYQLADPWQVEMARQALQACRDNSNLTRLPKQP